MGAASPKPGFYTDPENPEQERWWNGAEWTDNLRNAPRVPASMVSSLPDIPGYRIVSNLGLVSALSSNSGWTARTKGNIALGSAYDELRANGAILGANAIVGVTASTFGAGGGITNVVGGDAVGVLLIGTAVVIEPAH